MISLDVKVKGHRIPREIHLGIYLIKFYGLSFCRKFQKTFLSHARYIHIHYVRRSFLKFIVQVKKFLNYKNNTLWFNMHIAEKTNFDFVRIIVVRDSYLLVFSMSIIELDIVQVHNHINFIILL